MRGLRGRTFQAAGPAGATVKSGPKDSGNIRREVRREIRPVLSRQQKNLSETGFL